MEKVMTVEEKIKRAEQIYQKRRQNVEGPLEESKETNKKDIKLLKKMIIQILICASIYLVVYTIHSNQYVFSKDFTNKVNNILSYDTNFSSVYNNLKNKSQEAFRTLQFLNNKENGNENDKNNQNGKANEELKQENNKNNEEKIENTENQSENTEQSKEVAIGGAIIAETSNSQKDALPQTEQDIIDTKNTSSFIKPIEGTITSKFGQRDTATGRVPKNHTGIDIAANIGTKIKSATDGEVVLSSEEGDYGKHLKIQIGEVSVIYAHCNSLYVRQGDKVVQGQEIAEVGSTGNSTGPHLHFEIRYKERVVNPQNILEI